MRASIGILTIFVLITATPAVLANVKGLLDQQSFEDDSSNGNGYGKVIAELNARIRELEDQLAECQKNLEIAVPPNPPANDDDTWQQLEDDLNTCLAHLEDSIASCEARFQDGYWVPATNGTVPDNTVLSGWSPDRPYWVARTFIDGNLIPCKLTSPHGTCWTPWNKTEISMNVYEAYVDADIRWLPTNSNASIPERAVKAGWMTDKTGLNDTLYVGRAKINKQLVPGYVFDSTRILLHSTSYTNRFQDIYDILVNL